MTEEVPVALPDAPLAQNRVRIKADDFAINYLGGGDEMYGESYFSTAYFTLLRRQSALAQRKKSGGNNCGKDRFSELTARQPEEMGMVSNFEGARSWRNSKNGLAPHDWTFPKAMRAAGIVTGISGKCHAFGNAEDLSLDEAAERMGYDHHFMFAGPRGRQHPDLKAIRDADPSPERSDYYGRIDDMIFKWAEDFIRAQVAAGRRFSLDIAPRLVHTPNIIPAGYDTTKFDHLSGAYKIMAVQIERFANFVRRIDDLLHELGIADDTLFIVTSDQGGQDPANATVNDMVVEGNYRSRGYKPSTLYGNLNAPFIVRLPGVIPANSTIETSFIGVDETVASCAALGVDVPEDVSGENVLPAWMGDKTWRRSKRYFWLNAEGHAARTSVGSKGRDMAMFAPETEDHPALLAYCDEDGSRPCIFSVDDYAQDQDIYPLLSPHIAVGLIDSLRAWHWRLVDERIIEPEAA